MRDVYVFDSGSVGGEWKRGMGITNHVGIGGCWTCVCVVVVLEQGLEGWCYVYGSSESLCKWLVQVSVYCAMPIPEHPVAPQRYLLPAIQRVRMPPKNDKSGPHCWGRKVSTHTFLLNEK